MAGRHESPRQKMIGMMYLVLTALLALQVSSALIYKFQALNTSLEKTVNTNDADNRQKQASIASLVQQRGKKEREVKLSNEAQEIRVKTQQMLSEIETIKKELIEKSGGYNEDGSFKGAKEETQIEVTMIGASKSSGKAYVLKKKLDDYVTYMNNHSKEKFDGLARHASEDPALKNNSDQKNKDYAHLNFGQTPLVAALAVLSETEAKILDMESKLLIKIQKDISGVDFVVDKMKPAVKPVSDFVVAGTKYNAEMFMVATSSALKPKMEFNGAPMEVNGDGIGSLSFTASGGAYKSDGTMKKTWTGKITMKNPKGEDTTYLVTHEYTVVKPVIQVQSASVQALYRNCGNKLNISVPALGASYHPSFRIDGASVINGDRPGMVTLVPGNTTQVKVGVNNNGTFLGEERFGVRLVPLPTIEVKANGQKVNPIEGLPFNALRTMTVKAIPDKGFAEALPQDARYFISEGNVILARRKSKIKDVPITNGQVSLNSFAGFMQAGDRIIVEVLKVKRMNFRNEAEDVPIGKYYETIILN